MWPWRRDRSDQPQELENKLTVETFEGRYRTYTAAVLTAGALLLVALIWERGILEGADNKYLFGLLTDLNQTTQWLLWTMCMLLWALIDGVVAFGALLPNLRDLRARGSNQSLIIAFVCLFLMNLGGGMNLYVGEKKYQTKMENGARVSTVAHYYIMICLVVVIAIVDVMFISVVYVRYKNEYRSVTGRWFRVADAVQQKDIHGKRQRCLVYLEFAGDIFLLVFGGLIDVLVIFPAKAVWAVLVALYTFLILKTINFCYWMCSCCRRKEPVEDEDVLPGEVTGVSYRSLPKDDTDPVECPEEASLHGSGTDDMGDVNKSSRSASFPMQSYLSSMWSMIREDNSSARGADEESSFRHSGWVLGTMTTSLLLLVYVALKFHFFLQYYLNDIYVPYRTCVANNPAFVRESLRFVGYGGSYHKLKEMASRVISGQVTIPLSPFDIVVTVGRARTLHIGLQQVVEAFKVSDDPVVSLVGEIGDKLLMQDYDKKTDAIYDCLLDKYTEGHPLVAILNVVDESLLVEGHDPLEEFYDSTGGRMFNAIDAWVLHLRWAGHVGLAVGLLMGMKTLLSVLAQYKRSLLAVRACSTGPDAVPVRYDEMEIDLDNRLVRTVRDSEKVTPKFYPMSMSVYFMGILVSTVVLQFALSFTLVSLITALVASYHDLFVLVRPFLGIMIAVVINSLVDMFLVQRVFGERYLVEGYKVAKPNRWILFSIMYSFVHLILGSLFAMVRLVVTSFATITRLNRLDRNLFPAFKQMDTGEVAFGATVMLHCEALKRSAEKEDEADDQSDEGEGSGEEGPPTPKLGALIISALKRKSMIARAHLQEASTSQSLSVSLDLDRSKPLNYGSGGWSGWPGGSAEIAPKENGGGPSAGDGPQGTRQNRLSVVIENPNNISFQSAVEPTGGKGEG